LCREAAGRSEFFVGEQSLVGQTRNLTVDGVAGLHLDAEVIESPSVATVFDEDELQGWFGDREVRVARLDLGGGGVEQLGVERDRLVEVVNVEGELSAGHGGFPLPLRLMSNYYLDR
jgi:hypothetical protein